VPIIQDVSTDQIVSLEETLDYFSSIDIADREALLGGASTLRALANNRTFLAQLIVDELKNLDTLQQTNMYSAQVFTLGKGRNFFMRANFWPALNDSVVQVSGLRQFFYDTPHDHNFDFLTVGYHGPGYLSDFYEYDHDSVAGYIGEKVALRYVGREALPRGRIMLYRASVDIHNQLPPESFSISVNVMSDIASQVTTVNQYMLELPSGIITELGNRTSLPLICEAAAEIGDEECMDVLDQLRRTHPYPRGRFSAHHALARLRKQDAHRIWSEAAADPAKYVHVQARIRLAQMEGEALVTA
jgi:hypothetical protein